MEDEESARLFPTVLLLMIRIIRRMMMKASGDELLVYTLTLTCEKISPKLSTLFLE